MLYNNYTRSRFNSYRYSFFLIPFLCSTIPFDLVNSTSYSAFISVKTIFSLNSILYCFPLSLLLVVVSCL